MIDYIHFGKRSNPPCADCDGDQCTMNCGPAVPAASALPPPAIPKASDTTVFRNRPTRPTAKLPEGFRVLCTACGQLLEAETQFSAGQLKKKHPRCRACAPSKFHNRKDQGGDSRRESKKERELRTLEAAGLIRDLQCQVRFELIPAQYSPEGKLLERSLSYIADFVYFDLDGALHVVDSKGMRTDVYKLKRKLMLWIRKIRIEEA